MSAKIGNTWLSTEKYVYKPGRAIQDNRRMLDMIAEEEIEDLDREYGSDHGAWPVWYEPRDRSIIENLGYEVWDRGDWVTC